MGSSTGHASARGLLATCQEGPGPAKGDESVHQLQDVANVSSGRWGQTLGLDSSCCIE